MKELTFLLEYIITTEVKIVVGRDVHKLLPHPDLSPHTGWLEEEYTEKITFLIIEMKLYQFVTTTQFPKQHLKHEVCDISPCCQNILLKYLQVMRGYIWNGKRVIRQTHLEEEEIRCWLDDLIP